MNSERDRFWSETARRLTPYVPGEQPKIERLIKLNTNENPYPPSPLVLEAIHREAGRAVESLRLYPDPEADSLKRAIADYYGLTPGMVFVGNGSDEILAHTFCGLLKKDLPLLFPDITYSFYPVYCGLYGIDYRTIPLDEEFRIRIGDYFSPNGGIIFPNPNAPTGRLLPLGDIEDLVKRNGDSVVVVDEAYIDFGGVSSLGLVGKYPNLLIIQTLSKSRSLAGLRVGFAIGSPGLIDALERVKNSFNSYPLDRLALAGAVAAFSDRDHFERTRERIMKSRDRLGQALGELGFSVLPSAANFLFATHPGHSAKELSAKLRKRGIVVRHFQGVRIESFLRITIGTEEECQALVQALREEF